MDIMGIKWDVRRDIHGCSTSNDNNDMDSSKNEYLDALGYRKIVPPYFQTNPCGESKGIISWGDQPSKNRAVVHQNLMESR